MHIKIFEVTGISAARETSKFILLPEKRCHFLFFWCKSFENLLRCFDTKNKDVSRFVENVCENVLLYPLKLFPFTYRNDFIIENKNTFFFYVESISWIGKTVFCSIILRQIVFRENKCPKKCPHSKKARLFFKRKAPFHGIFEVVSCNILLCNVPIKIHFSS